MGVIRNLTLLILFLPAGSFAAPEPERKPESACVSCHRELGGEMAEPVTLWEKSIHHQMGNNCEGCHGGDPTDPAEAMNPAKGFIGAPQPAKVPSFCGKCHVGVLENYLKSPHNAAFLHGKGPNCVTCHMSHDVQKASFELISKSLCSQCHSYENGETIKRAFVSAEMALQKMKEDLHTLDRRGMPTKKLEGKFFSLRNALHQMTHTLNVDEIQDKTRGVLAELGEMEQEVVGLRRQIHRRWWTGGVVAAFLVLLIWVLVQLHKSLEKE